VILSGLCAAIIWNLLTWWLGIPSSSSHTLIGGFAGAGIAHAGSFDAISFDKISIILMFYCTGTIIRMLISYFISLLMLYLSRRSSPHEVDGIFRKLQVGSAALFSLMHGGNDAQKVVGIIAAALVAQGQIADLHSIPKWVPLCCYISIGLGTMMGGWRIVKTMGHKVTKLTPFEGFRRRNRRSRYALAYGQVWNSSEYYTYDHRKYHRCRYDQTSQCSALGVTISLLWAWILTIPISAFMGALIYLIASHI
jgi:PiT family inorganic phosphate transporter